MHTLGVKITFQKLCEEAVMPCIVHWYQRHFVVVYKISKDRIYVADPALGLLVYSFNEFKKGWLATKYEGQETGIVLLLEPTPKFYEQDSIEVRSKKKSLMYLLEYIHAHRSLFLQLITGLLTASLIQLALPFLTQSIVDVGINTQNIQFIYLVLMGQFVLISSRLAVDFIR